TSQRGGKVDSSGVRVGLAHEGDGSAVGRPGRGEKYGWMVGQLHCTLLPDLLDVEIGLVLLFITRPGENDLVPIRRKAGPDFKPGKRCEGGDGQRWGRKGPKMFPQEIDSQCGCNQATQGEDGEEPPAKWGR